MSAVEARSSFEGENQASHVQNDGIVIRDFLKRKGETSHSTQPSLRQRRRHFRQKEGTQLQLLGNGNFDNYKNGKGKGKGRKNCFGTGSSFILCVKDPVRVFQVGDFCKDLRM